ncbi:MAG: EVE domain-containing protein [Chloroflexi bacterium]|nr:EVE domain-containing protein [Chloroflexota bacterium]
MNYWVLTISNDNLRVTRKLGLTLQGFSLAHKKKVERMTPGDRLLYYVTTPSSFAATAAITSKYTEDTSPIWKPGPKGDICPLRVQIRPEVVLEEAVYLDARQIGPRLDYVRRWTPERWYLAFQAQQLHMLSRKDFDLIESEMRRVARQQPRVA